ncbi:MAG: T9SS type A sorting domain-containing protein, partial [candidate division KSB1 bacterium]|nr:T9SS type A sorting domain-containing protein [candidate division KSB1 bacterium]
VEIDKTLTLRGAGSSTIVQSPNTLTKYFTTTAKNYPIIWVHDADGVVIEDLVVDGAGKGNSNYRFVGIGYDNAGGTIEDVEIKDIRNTPINGAQHGVGILANSAEGTARTLNVNRCNIHGYQKNATVFNGADLAATITNNTITGAGAVNFIAQNGIQVSYGATANINGNTVSGHSYTPATWVATGMLLYLADANTNGNTISENQVGIYHINGSGTHELNHVSASAAGTGSPYFWGIIADPGEVPRPKPSPLDEMPAALGKTSNTTAVFTSIINENTLTGDGSAGSFGIGAYVFGTDVLNFTATTNIVTKWEYGFDLYKDAGATLNANIINCNQIYDNTAFGVYNPTGVVANAPGNWWGDPTGPTHASNPGGSGDVVSDDVDFKPWATDASCGGFLSHNFALLANYITVERSKQTPSKGDLFANVNIEFKRGDPTVFEGDLTAVGNICIAKENTINGDVTAGGTIKVDPSSTINGTKTPGASVAPIPLPVLSYSAGGPNRTIPQNGTLTLAPGSYGTVTMNGWTTLKLSSGDYYLNQLIYKGEESVIEIDVTNGPVTINVVSKLQLGKDIVIRVLPDGEAASTKVTFNTMQTSKLEIGKEAYVIGSINAPKATVVLLNNSQFRGGLCADKIEIRRDVLFLQHFAPGSLPGPDLLPRPSGDETLAEVVTDYELAQNYPNPFNPTTTIRFALPEAGNVTLAIYNTAGQLVRTLVDHQMSAGWQTVRWNGRDQSGKPVAAGVYLYRIVVQGKDGNAVFTETRRMTFLK